LDSIEIIDLENKHFPIDNLFPGQNNWITSKTYNSVSIDYLVIFDPNENWRYPKGRYFFVRNAEIYLKSYTYAIHNDDRISETRYTLLISYPEKQNLSNHWHLNEGFLDSGRFAPWFDLGIRGNHDLDFQTEFPHPDNFAMKTFGINHEIPMFRGPLRVSTYRETIGMKWMTDPNSRKKIKKQKYEKKRQNTIKRINKKRVEKFLNELSY
jgi:hypothetical protein